VPRDQQAVEAMGCSEFDQPGQRGRIHALLFRGRGLPLLGRPDGLYSSLGVCGGAADRSGDKKGHDRRHGKSRVLHVELTDCPFTDPIRTNFDRGVALKGTQAMEGAMPPLCDPQAPKGLQMARSPSAFHLPFHAHLLIVTQCRRRLLRQTFQTTPQARRCIGGGYAILAPARSWPLSAPKARDSGRAQRRRQSRALHRYSRRVVAVNMARAKWVLVSIRQFRITLAVSGTRLADFSTRLADF
jgi:hypothetical protein